MKRRSSELTVTSEVGRQFFRQRLSNQYANHMQLTVSIFKGVALGGGAVALIAIANSPQAAGVKVTALAMWMASLAAMIASYEGIMISTLVVDVPPNGRDLMAPFVLGVTEFTLFAILVPLPVDAVAGQPTTAAQLGHLAWWPMVFAVEAFITTAAIANNRRQVARTLAPAPLDVKALLGWYTGVLRLGQISTAAMGAVFVLAFVALRLGPEGLRHWEGVLGVIGLVGEVGGIYSQEQARDAIAASVAGGFSQLAEHDAAE